MSEALFSFTLCFGGEVSMYDNDEILMMLDDDLFWIEEETECSTQTTRRRCRTRSDS